jgi:energy-coupling factor transport system permease protein
MQIANAIETLFFPLSFFQNHKNKFNTITPKDIGLMVSIAVAFIPIIKNDFFNVRSALKSKGLKIGIRNFKYVLKPFLFLVLSRTNDITNALKAKAYQ